MIFIWAFERRRCRADKRWSFLDRPYTGGRRSVGRLSPAVWLTNRIVIDGRSTSAAAASEPTLARTRAVLGRSGLGGAGRERGREGERSRRREGQKSLTCPALRSPGGIK